ncbi:MAG: hypothetical protein IKT58_06905 [Oscillospiraceae bacterium]|nr:hypothetical protein [Oscillospiraceae bacterium]
MDPYDPRAVRAVWERVRQCHEQLLSSMIAGELQDLEFYRRMAKQAGPMSKQLLSIAAEEETHLRQLRELYSKLYGKTAPEEPPVGKRYKTLRQALEAQKEKELLNAQSYEKAANHFSENAELFRTLSEDEKAHSALLSSLLDRSRSSGARPIPSQGRTPKKP